MRKVCLFLCGMVFASFGMDRDFRIERCSQGVVKIRELKARQTKELTVNQSEVFQGFEFRNFSEQVTSKPCNFADHFGSVEIHSEKALSIRGFLASECKVFAPELTVLGNWRVDNGLEFFSANTLSFIGAEVFAKDLRCDGQDIKMELSDIKGAESCKVIGKSLIQNGGSLFSM